MITIEADICLLGHMYNYLKMKNELMLAAL